MGDGLLSGTCHVHITRAPQLLQIDTAGCMEVVRERKAQTPALLQTGARDPAPGLLQVRSRGEHRAQAHLACVTPCSLSRHQEVRDRTCSRVP